MLQKSTETPYGKAFFASQSSVSYTSAKSVLPFVREIVNPKTVIDVGCGVGTWIRAWDDLGVSDGIGVDGAYVNKNELYMSPDRFISMDLTKPTSIAGSPFDLAQTLEVAEHLPREAASDFVKFLCTLSPAVLFSAAIPFQGGTAHLNEQWPEFWADLFLRHDYWVYDVLRPKLWTLDDVEYYYAQNMFLFVRANMVSNYPALAQLANSNGAPLARVHPRKWEERVLTTPHLEDLITSIPRSSADFVNRAARRLQRSRTT